MHFSEGTLLANQEWVNINLGLGVDREGVTNIAREVRGLFVDNVYPNGERQGKAQLKVTRDSLGQYHVHLNQQALLFILLFASRLMDQRKQATIGECPAEVPEFLRWAEKPAGDLKPE